MYSNLVSSIIQMWLLLTSRSCFRLVAKHRSRRPLGDPNCWMTLCLLDLTIAGRWSILLCAAELLAILAPYWPALAWQVFKLSYFREGELSGSHLTCFDPRFFAVFFSATSKQCDLVTQVAQTFSLSSIFIESEAFYYIIIYIGSLFTCIHILVTALTWPSG